MKIPSVLDAIIKEGAQRLLQQALEAEVQNFLSEVSGEKLESGKKAVVRNGYYNRSILSPVGELNIEIPRTKDRAGLNRRYTTSILPPYARKTPCLENLIPVLYLKGISTGGMNDALEAILGEQARKISPAVISSLKEQWAEEYKEWNGRSLAGLIYDYIWVDAVYFNCKSEENLRYCMLVMIGCKENGRKELVSLKQGFRESSTSWSEMIIDLINRGLTAVPKLIIGDGALGIWQAIEENWADAKQQRCWIHKQRNILDKLPKSLFTEASEDIKKMYMANNKETAIQNYRLFCTKYSRYKTAVDCVAKDEDLLFNFFDFPANYWKSLRNTNTIESAFSTVRLRTNSTRGIGSAEMITAMTFKLLKDAESHWKSIRRV